jgi:DNA-binding transcriptional MerR regulator
MSRKVSPPASPVYTTADLLRLTTATKGNLIHWSAIQLIQPDIEDATGSGHHKRYSALNVIEVDIAAHLSTLKVPTALIAYALDGFRGFHEAYVALWQTGPLDGDHFTDAQRSAYERVHLRVWQRRHRRRVTSVLITDEKQREMLRLARVWHHCLYHPGATHGGRFFLVVNPFENRPSEARAWVVDGAGLGQSLTGGAALVVNLDVIMSELSMEQVHLRYQHHPPA